MAVEKSQGILNTNIIYINEGMMERKRRYSIRSTNETTIGNEFLVDDVNVRIRIGPK